MACLLLLLFSEDGRRPLLCDGDPIPTPHRHPHLHAFPCCMVTINITSIHSFGPVRQHSLYTWELVTISSYEVRCFVTGEYSSDAKVKVPYVESPELVVTISCQMPPIPTPTLPVWDMSEYKCTCFTCGRGICLFDFCPPVRFIQS